MLRKRLFWIVALALVLTASGGYWYYSNIYLQAQEPASSEETISTYTVSTGDLTITASGSGTLIPASEVAVGFENGGVLAEVLAQVGDQVEAGQLLARLDDADAQDQVAQAEISLRQAELDLAALSDEVDAADLAAAQASLSSAKANLTALTSPASDQELLAAQQSLKSAKEALADLLDGPDEDTVESAKADRTLAEMSLRIAQAAYDQIAWEPNVGTTQEAMDLWEATTNYEKAQADYDEAVQGATADEISEARAEVAQAQAALDALLEEPDPDEVAAAEAQVTQAQAELDALLAGASTKDLEAAQLNVEQAQLDLDSVQRTLAATQLTAPVAGTVVAVDAQVGESLGSETFITLADMQNPRIEFWVEEADLSSVSPGNRVSIVFEALPDYTFSGQILSVDPALVDVDGTTAVQSYASVDLSTHPVTLLSGMNADVEVVAGEALNAVLVPVQALRELGDVQAGNSQYAVFVVQPDGDLEMRVVEVGLKDYVNAVILSGLEPGEVISLGTSTTGSGTTTVTGTESQEEGGMPMGGGMPFLDGGGPPAGP
jgi:HlyD family secretion protein